MKELALFIARQLADHPDQVAATETDQGGTTEIRLACAENDKGRLIGKQGKVIKAIRTLVALTASRAGRKVDVDVD